MNQAPRVYEHQERDEDEVQHEENKILFLDSQGQCPSPCLTQVPMERELQGGRALKTWASDVALGPEGTP